MGFLASLVAAPKSLQVLQNTFLIEFQEAGETIFMFLEGRDDESVYRAFAASRIPVNFSVRTVRCGNRAGVLEFLNWYNARYNPNPRALFFVDRDFSDFCGPALPSSDVLFVTCGYSTESYLFNREVVHRVLVELFGLHDNDPAAVVVAEQFDRAKRTFEDLMRPVMAWCIAARLSGAAPVLANLKMNKLVVIDGDALPKRRLHGAALYITLKSWCGTISISHAAVMGAEALIRDGASQAWLRGKQALWFLVTYLKVCYAALRRQSSGGSVKAHLEVTMANAVEVLISRAPIPPALDSFLRQHWNAL